jgi:Kef-type K+ transport system membrane component KefB
VEYSIPFNQNSLRPFEADGLICRMQVLQERGESTSRHGRATFSVLLFQDLAVVVLLILIPLISPNSSKGGVGFNAIAEALGLAAVKAVVAITGIIAGGRLVCTVVSVQMEWLYVQQSWNYVLRI